MCKNRTIQHECENTKKKARIEGYPTGAFFTRLQQICRSDKAICKNYTAWLCNSRSTQPWIEHKPADFSADNLAVESLTDKVDTILINGTLANVEHFVLTVAHYVFCPCFISNIAFICLFIDATVCASLYQDVGFLLCLAFNHTWIPCVVMCAIPPPCVTIHSQISGTKHCLFDII